MNQRDLRNTIHLGDCFDFFGFIEVTACAWDVELDLGLLWEAYKRILKPGGAVVLTATQPFETKLINSNRKWFRYKWVWKKSRAVGFLNAKKMPLRVHEDVLVFAPKSTKYNPQFTFGKPYVSKRSSKSKGGVYREMVRTETKNPGVRFPKDVVEFSNTCEKVIHSTQKPVELFKYLIRTYTDPGDLVLDNASGSGTTAIAAKETGRNFICIEKDLVNWQLSMARISGNEIYRESA